MTFRYNSFIKHFPERIMKPMHKPYKILGKKIGHIKVISYLGTFNKMKKYLVRCECGFLHETYGKTLMSVGEKNTDYRCEKCRVDPLRLSKMNVIRLIDSKAWSSWQYMVTVCFPTFGNTNRHMNKKWYDFFEFLRDMSEPKDDQCLVLLKQYGEYNKNSCKWMERSKCAIHVKSV